MTPIQINQAVARKLGWIQCCNSKTMEYGKIVDCFGWSKGGSHFHELCPGYCYDIKAAWEIVDHLNTQHYAVKIISMPMLGHCSISKDGEEPFVIENHNTVSMSICLAFLKLP